MIVEMIVEIIVAVVTLILSAAIARLTSLATTRQEMKKQQDEWHHAEDIEIAKAIGATRHNLLLWIDTPGAPSYRIEALKSLSILVQCPYQDVAANAGALEYAVRQNRAQDIPALLDAISSAFAAHRGTYPTQK